MKLKNYIQGNRKGKEANRIERDALNDPFLQDALDGFDAVEGDHWAEIEKLQQKISLKSDADKVRKFPHWRVISIAASFILILGVGTLLLLKPPVPAETTEAIAHIEEEFAADTLHESLADESTTESKEAPLIAKHDVPKQIELPTLIDNMDYAEQIDIVSIEDSDAYIFEDEIKDVIPYTADVEEESTFSNSILTKNSKKSNNVAGIILDETGNPVIGAAVVAQGTNIGTLTDFEGKYHLQLPDTNVMLMANYMGYHSVEIPLAEEATIHMKENNLAMNEVVVVGYGSQKRKAITGAASNMSKEILSAEIPGLTIEEILGKKEFLEYFEKNSTKNICGDIPVTLKATFYVDETGKPINIEVTESACEALTNEFIKLLNETRWAEKEKKQQIKIK